LSPFDSKKSTRWEPIKPAPPVTSEIRTCAHRTSEMVAAFCFARGSRTRRTLPDWVKETLIATNFAIMSRCLCLVNCCCFCLKKHGNRVVTISASWAIIQSRRKVYGVRCGGCVMVARKDRWIVPIVVMLVGALWQPGSSRAMPIISDFEGSEYTVRMTFPSLQSPLVSQRNSLFGSVYTNTGVSLFQGGEEIASGPSSNLQIFPNGVSIISDGSNTITETVPSTYNFSTPMTCTLCGPYATSPITVTVALQDPSGFMTQNSITATAFVDDVLRIITIPALITQTAFFVNSTGVIDIGLGTTVITDTLVAVVNRTASVVAEPMSLLLLSMGLAAMGVGARFYRQRRP